MAESYDDIKAIRATHLKVLAARSPAHYQDAVEREGDGSTDTASRCVYRAIHAAVLDPKAFGSSFQLYDAKNSKGGQASRTGAIYEAWKGAHPGAEALLSGEYWEILEVAHAVREHPVAGPIVRASPPDGWSERVLEWADPRTGLPCKARLDKLLSPGFLTPEAWILDLKGVDNCAPDHVAWLARRNDWYLQLAHYRAGFQALKPGAPVRCGLIPVETTDRLHDCNVLEIPTSLLDEAEERRQGLLDIIAACTRSGAWPGNCVEIGVLPDISEPDIIESNIEEEDNG